jgi:Flp pilus assembly protein TadG
MRFLRQLARNTDAAEIAELAMVLPVMFLTFLGIFWMGRAYNIYATINQAAREGARVAASTSCATCGNYTGCATPYGCDNAVVQAVTNSLQADHLDLTAVDLPSPALSPTFCPAALVPSTCTNTASNITVCRNVSLTPPGVSPQECGVIVAFQYEMFSTLPLVNGSPGLQAKLQDLKIRAQAQVKVEQ